VNYDLSESNFAKARVENCTFINCFMQFCAMTGVQIRNCEFKDYDLWHSNLCHSSIKRSAFNNCILGVLYKALDWQNNVFDEATIVESCSDSDCKMNEEMAASLHPVGIA